MFEDQEFRFEPGELMFEDQEFRFEPEELMFEDQEFRFEPEKLMFEDQELPRRLPKPEMGLFAPENRVGRASGGPERRMAEGPESGRSEEQRRARGRTVRASHATRTERLSDPPRRNDTRPDRTQRPRTGTRRARNGTRSGSNAEDAEQHAEFAEPTERGEQIRRSRTPDPLLPRTPSLPARPPHPQTFPSRASSSPSLRGGGRGRVFASGLRGRVFAAESSPPGLRGRVFAAGGGSLQPFGPLRSLAPWRRVPASRQPQPEGRTARSPVAQWQNERLLTARYPVRVQVGEFSTPSRNRGGVLVDGRGRFGPPGRGRGKSRWDGGFGGSRPTRRALGLEAEFRGPTATPTVALAPPAATLSNSRALWLTPPAR